MSKWDSGSYNTTPLFFFSVELIFLGSVSLPMGVQTISREKKTLPPQGSSVFLFPPGCWETLRLSKHSYRVLFKRSSRHSPMSQQLCHSSRAGTVVGTTSHLDLRKETAAKTNSILGCRSRNSQEISALIRAHLDTASCFGTRNTGTNWTKCSGGALVTCPKRRGYGSWGLFSQSKRWLWGMQQQPQHLQRGHWEHSLVHRKQDLTKVTNSLVWSHSWPTQDPFQPVLSYIS